MLRSKRKHFNEKPPKSQPKAKNQEDKKIKRILKEKEIAPELKKPEIKPEVYDLWGETNKKPLKIRAPVVKYPKVPLPHPGQSYNPNKADLKNLLKKVVEVNKTKIDEEVVPEPTIELENNVFEESDEEEENLEGKIEPVSNNPPVDETQRLTKKDIKRKVISFFIYRENIS